MVNLDDDDIEIITTYDVILTESHIEDDSGDDDDDDDDDKKSEAEIKTADIIAGKAIIHSVDELLIPASLLLSSAPVDVPLPAASRPAAVDIPVSAGSKWKLVQKTDKSKEE